MRDLFCTTNKEQHEKMFNYLLTEGFEIYEKPCVRYQIIRVDNKEYINALTIGVDFSNEKKLDKIFWLDAFGERQLSVNGGWPIAYLVMDRKKFNLDEVDSLNIPKELPGLWIDRNRKDVLKNQISTSFTPMKITKMLDELNAITCYSFLIKHKINEDAIILSALCHSKEQVKIRGQVIDYLNKNKIFERVIPLEKDGSFFKPANLRKKRIQSKNNSSHYSESSF